jgi:hypothetical protein
MIVPRLERGPTGEREAFGPRIKEDLRMAKAIARALFAGVLAVTFAGCRSMGSGSSKDCVECLNGTCTRHPAGSKLDADADAVTTPGPSPFAPFKVKN